MVKTSIDNKQSKPRVDPQNPQAGAQSVSYQVTTLQYEYDKVDERTGVVTRCVGPLAVEGPELFSPNGIMCKNNASGYETASLFTIFDFQNEEVKQFCSLGESHTGMKAGFWQVFYKWCLDRIWELRGQIPAIQRLPSKEALLGTFAYPIFFARDPQTSEVVAGSNPTKYFNLMCRGKPGSAMRKETLFNAPIVVGNVGGKAQYKSLSWDILKNVEMKYKPIITFKQLYSGGGKITLQFEVSSAVVVSVTPINSVSSQEKALKDYAADSNITSAISSQIDLLSRRLKEDFVVEGKESLESKNEMKTLEGPTPLPSPAQSQLTFQAPTHGESPPFQGSLSSALVGSAAQTIYSATQGSAPTLASVLGSGPVLVNQTL